MIRLLILASLSLLILNACNASTNSDEPKPYQVEVLDATGSRVMQSPGLGLSEIDNLRFGFPLELMPAGDYEVRLHGLDGDRREQLQAISVRVLYE